MATTQLQLYNIALAAIGERSLTSLTETAEARTLLDEVYNRGNGIIRYFLEQGYWNHAMRAVKLDALAAVEPEFGFTEAFDRPTDMVRLAQMSADETFASPENNYEIEGAYIYANVDPLYVRYVSDDADWGADFAKWPETFTLYAGTWMATQIAPRLKSDLDMERLEKRAERYLKSALMKDASFDPVRFPPLSSWASARLGGVRGERGSRNALTER